MTNKQRVAFYMGIHMGVAAECQRAALKVTASVASMHPLSP